MRNFIRDREKFLGDKSRLEKEIAERTALLSHVNKKIRELDDLIARAEKYEKTIKFESDANNDVTSD